MKTIVLIRPNGSVGYYERINTIRGIELPLWLVILARYYEVKGYKPIIVDAELENLTSLETAESTKRFNPDEVLIFCSGSHPSAFVQQKAIAEELETLFEMEGIKVEVKDYLPIIPFKFSPKWESVPMDAYKAHNWMCFGGNKRQPYGVVYTSLGCPFSCFFCNIHSFYQYNYTSRKVEDVLKDFDTQAIVYGIRNFKIMDELFALDNTRVKQICEGLIAREYSKDLNIWAYARIDTVTPELLKLMRKAGITWIAYGIETGNDKIRKDVLKGKFNNQKIKEVVRMTQDAGINVLGNYMFGFWEDTLETMHETLNFAKELNCEYANFYCTVSYPNSKLYNIMKEKGVDVERQPIEYAQMSNQFRPIPTKYLSEKEVLEFRDKAFLSYFTSSKYLTMIKEKFGWKTVVEIEKMCMISIERDILK